MNASTAATVWEARPMHGDPGLPGARCRALAAHLAEADAILARPAGSEAPGGGARPR